MWSAFVAAVASGCAGGADVPPALTGTPPPPTTADPTTGGPDESGDTTAEPLAESTGDKEDDDTTTGSPPATDTETEEPDTDEGGDTSTGSAVDLCELDTVCSQAETLGGVSGDEASPPLTQIGEGPEWFSVEVSENNDGVVGEPLSVTVRLDSTDGDFDLYAYLGDVGGTSGCGGIEKSSIQAIGIDAVAFDWGEGALGNNAEDDAFIAIQVVPKDDICIPGSSWTLTVTGDS